MLTIMLVDNGSRKPEATLRLRDLAGNLGACSGKTINPVSLQHADKIDPDELNGIPADTFAGFIQRKYRSGCRSFLVLPLFFGDSGALTSFLPQQVEELRKELGYFSMDLAEVVYPLSRGDERLAQIILDHIDSVQKDMPSDTITVLVDHGSPNKKITEVRERVARRLTMSMPPGSTLAEAVMERRPGKEYDFNGMLLQDWLRDMAQKGCRSIIIAMLFFLPGRHAGASGDIEEICNKVAQDYPGLQYRITPLVAEHPLLLDILKDRLVAAVARIE